MIGLDTNILLRYLLQDDAAQSPAVNRLFEQELSEESPGCISLVTILEIVWVMRGKLRLTAADIVQHLDWILNADVLVVQNRQEVFQAMTALEDGTGEFEDALIGALNQWSGCTESVTFDQKAARLPYFRLLE